MRLRIFSVDFSPAPLCAFGVPDCLIAGPPNRIPLPGGDAYADEAKTMPSVAVSDATMCFRFMIRCCLCLCWVDWPVHPILSIHMFPIT